MSKKLLFVVLAVVTVTGAFAETTTQTVPTQSYVDTNFQTKIPAGTVNKGSVVSYTDEAGTVGERGIYNNFWPYMAYLSRAYNSQNTSYAYLQDYLPTMNDLTNVLKYISSSAGAVGTVPASSGNEHIWIAAFANNADKPGFTHINAINSASVMSSSNDPSQYIPTMKAMEEKQNKMTCTRWLDNADETDENCLLWSLSN
ncbi:MAG: hypothetical protein IJQ90_01960 [Alphaproteobacteria bacterium]|nr:hypothetical protein [Alphaproteobacteria bacterium]